LQKRRRRGGGEKGEGSKQKDTGKTEQKAERGKEGLKEEVEGKRMEDA
jgi:hypothetical protein